MNKLLPVALLCMSSVAAADELIVNLASYHINSVYEFNENNFGLGYRNTTDNYEVGFYRNSYYKTDSEYANGAGYSVYLKGRAYDTPINKYISINIDFGLAIYGKDGTLPFMPIIQPMIIVKPLKDFSVNIGYMPLFAEVTAGIDENQKKSVMHGLLTLSAGYSF